MARTTTISDADRDMIDDLDEEILTRRLRIAEDDLERETREGKRSAADYDRALIAAIRDELTLRDRPSPETDADDEDDSYEEETIFDHHAREIRLQDAIEGDY